MKINGVEFEAREIQTIHMALDRMQAEELDHVDSLGEREELDAAGQETYDAYLAEANIARDTDKKFREMLRQSLVT